MSHSHTWRQYKRSSPEASLDDTPWYCRGCKGTAIFPQGYITAWHKPMHTRNRQERQAYSESLKELGYVEQVAKAMTSEPQQER
jgi:hypothetical protein|tara:strand:+ start:38 stop:289 length:252 start_codon:yes stop_codon:yes gene_type:complete